MSWEVLWLIGTTVTQQCHPTAARALGDGARPDASISPSFICSLATEDAARQQDARGDMQVAKMGSVKEKAGIFHQEGFLSSFIAARSTARSILRTRLQLGRGLIYFTLSQQFDSQGTGKASQHSPAVPGSPWQSFNYSPGEPCPAVLEERGQLAALPSLSPVLMAPVTQHCWEGVLGGHPTASPAPARWVSHPWLHPWPEPKLLAGGGVVPSERG